jgi:hypothetical protein
MDIRKVTRKEVALAIEYCINILGASKYCPIVPTLVYITSNKIKAIDRGCYDSENNRILVYRKKHRSIVDLADTVIHEYTHYLQDMEKYTELAKSFNYREHPYELEAIENANKYKWQCRKFMLSIKNKIPKNRKTK